MFLLALFFIPGVFYFLVFFSHFHFPASGQRPWWPQGPSLLPPPPRYYVPSSFHRAHGFSIPNPFVYFHRVFLQKNQALALFSRHRLAQEPPPHMWKLRMNVDLLSPDVRVLTPCARVMVRPCSCRQLPQKRVTSKKGNKFVLVLLGWRFVFGIIVRQGGHMPSLFRW